MKVEGSYTFKAPRDQVYQTLLDPDALRACLPGVQRFEKVGEDQYEATMKIGVAAVKGEYAGKVQIQNKQEPSHYEMAIEGSGGPGFVKGIGSVDLEDKDSGTLLKYVGDAQVGGMLAGVAQRMLPGITKMMAGEFFKAMEKQIQSRSGAA